MSVLSEALLQGLYLQTVKDVRNPSVQILGFQASGSDSKEITVRISDKQCFLDCVLIGPYWLEGGAIRSSDSLSKQVFKRFDVIRMNDYFCKIDQSKICHLKIIIRKISEGFASSRMLGNPEETSQFIQNLGLVSIDAVKHESKLLHFGSAEAPVKIEDEGTFLHHLPPKASSQDHYLSLRQILQNKTGVFIGRLVRMKGGVTEKREGPMSYLYLGFVDRNGELAKFGLMGRIAIKESRELKRQRCYEIKGFQLLNAEKGRAERLIRLKDKEYKIQEIKNEQITCQYKSSYYNWDHDCENKESDTVDVVGVIVEIESKMSYKQENPQQQQREVVRVVVRNIHKTVKINFWTNHLKVLDNYDLKRNQPVLFEDIKKKKSLFHDFTAESTIVLLDEDTLTEKISHFLPAISELTNPKNLKQLLVICQQNSLGSNSYNLNLRLVKIDEQKIIYKICSLCRKPQKESVCSEGCLGEFFYRYNSQFQFGDATGSAMCVGFDSIGDTIFGMTAEQFARISYLQHKELFQNILYQQFKMSLEIKNNRIFIRKVERASGKLLMDILQQNLEAIRQIRALEPLIISL